MRSPEALPPGWLRERLGVALVGQRPVGGGSIHRAWCLSVEGGASDRLFAKTNAASRLPLLEAEAEGLAALATAAAATGLSVPQPLALGLVADRAVLVLAWLERSAPEGGDWRRLGQGLALLHRASRDQLCAPGDRADAFGWSSHNWIGSAPQTNGWHPDWGEFFMRCRLAPQARLLADRGWTLPGLDRLLEHPPAWLLRHRPEACLVHGDLWSGNAMARVAGPGVDPEGGAGAIFDPAVHRGDREVDLAMARLFGGFRPEFFEGYEAAWPLPEGHRQREGLYNLYHLLNHANLFGRSYLEQAAQVVSECLRS